MISKNVLDNAAGIPILKKSLMVRRVVGDPSQGELFSAETPSGTVGFEGPNASPMDTVAAALGGCLAITISEILLKMRQDLQDIQIHLEYLRHYDRPTVFTSFDILVTVQGEAISEEKLHKAVEMAEEAHCPVSVMLRRAGVEINTTHILNDGRKKTVSHEHS